jgi:CMP-N,N'-diacetyllegionaminic acid synthase
MIICIIPARGGSKGIPRKNLVPFAGRPLVEWTISQAKDSKIIDQVIVSTDDGEIKDLALGLGVKVISRPAELASDTATSESALLHALKEARNGLSGDVEHVVFLQATSPLRIPGDIDRAIDLIRSEKADSLFSGAELGDFFVWEKAGKGLKSVNYDHTNRKRRQDTGRTYVENGSMYIFKPEVLEKFNNRLGGKISVYPMKFWQSFEIDDAESLELCEWLFKKHIGR